MSANTHAQHSVSFSLIAIFASAKMSKGISHENALILILRASLSHSLLTVNRKFAGTFNSNHSNNSAASAAAYAVAH